MDPSKIVNNAYHSAILCSLVITNSVLSKKILNMKPIDLGRISMKDGAMLTLNVFIAMMIKRALIDQGILPPRINFPM